MSTTLHEAFADLASAVEQADLAPRVHAGLRRRRQRRVAGVAAATGLLSLVTLALVVRPAEKPSGIATVPTASPAPVHVVAEPLYDVLWFAPAGNKWGLHGLRQDGTTEVAVPRCSLCSGGDLSPDGRRFADAGASGLTVASLADGTTKTIPVRALGEHGAVPDVAWGPDNRMVAVVDHASFDGATGVSSGFFLVDTQTGTVTRVAYAHRNFGLAWSPDGTRIAVVSPTGTVDLLTRTGTRVQRLAFPSFPRLSQHAWSPDGTRLLVGLEGERTAVVTIATGEVTGRLGSARRYVWRDAGHVACECTDGVVTEHRLDGTTTKTLVRLSSERGGTVLIRPAS